MNKLSRIYLLIVIIFFILLITICKNFHMPSMIYFIIAGLITGLYYGWYNHAIFHQIKEPNEHVKINNLWIHLLCGFFGALAMYIVFININFPAFTFKRDFSWQDFIFLFIGLLGYTGLLPRTLWFFASKGELPKHN